MIIGRLNHGGSTHWNVDTETTEIPFDAILSGVQLSFERDIDNAAGAARAAFVSPGSYIDQEYLLAKQEASEWLANGKDESSVPASVADHVAMTGQTTEEAANEIVATAEQWEQALSAIRSLRLAGKTAVRQSETVEAKEAAAQNAITQLKAFRPQ
ncbi:hypothetical protein [Vreelandella alkaliphila]|uniref:Uncharacterized protein n=1 Tax=Vreelandella alkaliphila TaxID=272774 RepID=A0AAJ2RW97_9GAMM|nr:hypothetical protein [Halomonas alkaliphila]MDX5979638.1 hypothetical protein [Halomonas alkaliphila]